MRAARKHVTNDNYNKIAFRLNVGDYTDTIDFKIIKAIDDLKVPYPSAERINSLVKLDPEELGARLGVLEMQGYVKTQSEPDTKVSSLPNGIIMAGLTKEGKRALAGPRW